MSLLTEPTATTANTNLDEIPKYIDEEDTTTTTTNTENNSSNDNNDDTLFINGDNDNDNNKKINEDDTDIDQDLVGDDINEKLNDCPATNNFSTFLLPINKIVNEDLKKLPNNCLINSPKTPKLFRKVLFADQIS